VPGDPLECFDEFTRDLIRTKAKRIVRKAKLSKSDYDDVIQDMAALILEKRQYYNPDRGTWEAFVTTALRRYAANLIAASQSMRRNGGRPIASLDACNRTGHTIKPNIPDNRSAANEDILDMAAEISYVVCRLSPECREVYGCLATEGSQAAAARKLGMSLDRFRTKMKEIREAFANAGLKDYIS